MRLSTWRRIFWGRGSRLALCASSELIGSACAAPSRRTMCHPSLTLTSANHRRLLPLFFSFYCCFFHFSLHSMSRPAELLYIWRPVLYVALLRRYGRSAWAPWLASLAVEVGCQAAQGRAVEGAAAAVDAVVQPRGTSLLSLALIKALHRQVGRVALCKGRWRGGRGGRGENVDGGKLQPGRYARDRAWATRRLRLLS